MRKILSMVLVLTLILGSSSFAFAAQDSQKFSDVDDENVLEAVQRLSAFSIVDGYEDGTYQPEKEITRAEFAKLLVTALGLDTAAQAAKTTRFSDAADAWYTGYVEVAAGQGLVNGYPDGTFQPDKTVSYSEAVTMLVRSLGYKDSFLPGSWPGNYIAKAADQDITDDVSFTPNGFADRGSVAVLLNNTLDADVVKVDTYEGDTVKYYESGVSLLEDKLEIDKVEDLRVIADKRLEDKLDADEIKVLALEDDVEIDDVNYGEDDEVDVEYTDGVNPEQLIGLEITGYFDDDVLLYAEVETQDSSHFRSIAYEDDYQGSDEDVQGRDDDGKLYIWDADDYYKFDDNVRLYINNEDRTDDIEWDDDDDGELIYNLKELFVDYNPQQGKDKYAFGNVVIEKGKVTFVDVSVFENINAVVEDVDTDEEVIKYTDSFETANDDEDLDLSDYDEYTIYDLDGNEMSLDDIEKDDIVYFYEDAEDDDLAFLLVKKADVVSGELTKVKDGAKDSDKDQTRGKVYLDDEAISLADYFAYTLDDGESLDSGEKNLELSDKFEDVFGEPVEVVKDLQGKVAIFRTSVDSSTGDYAVVTGVGSNGIDDELKLWTAAGEEIRYDVDDFFHGISLGDPKEDHNDNMIYVGDIIKYDVESNGEIDVEAIVYHYSEDKDDDGSAGRIYDDDDDDVDNDIDGAVKLVALDDINDDNVKAVNMFVDDETGDLKGGSTDNYFDVGGSLYFDYSEYLNNNHDDKDDNDNDDDDLQVVKWDEFADLDVPSPMVNSDNDDDGNILGNAVKVLIVTDEDDTDEIDFMAFIKNYDEVVDDDSFVGYVIDKEQDDDIMTVNIDVFGEGLQEYTITDDDDQDNIDIERPLVFVLRGGELNPKDDDYDDNSYEQGWTFVEKDGDYIDLEKGTETRSVRVDDDAVVYYEDEDKNVNDLDEGDEVNYILQDGKAVVIKYTEWEDLEDTDDDDPDMDEITFTVNTSGEVTVYGKVYDADAEDDDGNTWVVKVTNTDGDEGNQMAAFLATENLKEDEAHTFTEIELDGPATYDFKLYRADDMNTVVKEKKNQYIKGDE